MAEKTTMGKYPFSVAGIFAETMAPSFNSKGDTMPTTLGITRVKWIHAVGTHAKVKFISSGNHPYTGIFKGADHGVIRLSSAAQPAADNSQPLAPGMGLKFLRSGRDSANLVSMYSVYGNPKGDWNFFS